MPVANAKSAAVGPTLPGGKQTEAALDHRSEQVQEFILALACSAVMVVIFWSDLVLGGSLIGGDVFTYFMPQKQVLADALKEGEWALWNPYVGFGYPALAESQTGSLYLPNLILYRCFSVSSAYAINQLLHYFVAFAGAWLFARRIGISTLASLFASLVFVYSWFPPRICLEWAIIGGAYFPLAFWCAECWLQTAKWRYPLGLSFLLALQLTAGHFNLAFIELVCVTVYAGLRLSVLSVATADHHDQSGAQFPTHRLTLACGLLVAILCGFLLALPQLIPSWELKHLSQRGQANWLANTAYGHCPPLGLTQMIAPWAWYQPGLDLDGAIQSPSLMGVSAGTNKVEAHLYFGIIPFWLSVLGCASGLIWPRGNRAWIICGLSLAFLALAYCTAYPLFIMRLLPGFSFFSGPARWGMVAGWLIALAAAAECDRWRTRLGEFWWRGALALIAGLTIYDLGTVSQLVTYAFPIANSPIDYRDKSEVRALLLKEGPATRLLAPGQNLPATLGVPTCPVYLGIGPQQYFEPDFLAINTALKKLNDPASTSTDGQTPQQDIANWMASTACTHWLTFNEVPNSTEYFELAWVGFDQFLSRAWGRTEEPLYLYRLRDKHRLPLWQGPPASGQALVTGRTTNSITVEVSCQQAGDIILPELAYPGWSMYLDGQLTPTTSSKAGYRQATVPSGQHLLYWRFEPFSFEGIRYLSAIVVVLMIVAAIAIAIRSPHSF